MGASHSGAIPCNIVETSKTIVKASFRIQECVAFDQGDVIIMEFEMLNDEQLLPKTIKFVGTTGHRDKFFQDTLLDCAPANEKIIDKMQNQKAKSKLLKHTSYVPELKRKYSVKELVKK